MVRVSSTVTQDEPLPIDAGAPARRRERSRPRAGLALAPIPLAHRGCGRRRRCSRGCPAPVAHVGLVHPCRPLHHDGDRPRDHGDHPADGRQLGDDRAGQRGQSELPRLGHRDCGRRQGRPDRHAVRCWPPSTRRRFPKRSARRKRSSPRPRTGSRATRQPARRRAHSTPTRPRSRPPSRRSRRPRRT